MAIPPGGGAARWSSSGRLRVSAVVCRPEPSDARVSARDATPGALAGIAEAIFAPHLIAPALAAERQFVGVVHIVVGWRTPTRRPAWRPAGGLSLAPALGRRRLKDPAGVRQGA